MRRKKKRETGYYFQIVNKVGKKISKWHLYGQKMWSYGHMTLKRKPALSEDPTAVFGVYAAFGRKIPLELSIFFGDNPIIFDCFRFLKISGLAGAKRFSKGEGIFSINHSLEERSISGRPSNGAGRQPRQQALHRPWRHSRKTKFAEELNLRERGTFPVGENVSI